MAVVLFALGHIEHGILHTVIDDYFDKSHDYNESQDMGINCKNLHARVLKSYWQFFKRARGTILFGPN